MTPTLRNILIPILIVIAFVGVALGIANYRKQVNQKKATQNEQQAAPDVTLTSPQDQEKISAADVTVKGETEPGNKVTVDGKDVMVGQDGFFETSVPLNQKENKIVVDVTDANGNKTVIERTVLREGAIVAGQPNQLSQTGPAETLMVTAGVIFLAYLARRSSQQGIVTSLKKY